MSDASLKDGDIVERLVEVGVAGCDCDFTDTFITDRVFQCFPSSPHAVTYHAQLHSALNNSVSRLVAYLQEWASSGVSIPVQFLPLAVDNFCLVPSSTPVEHCPDNMMSITTSTSVPTVSTVSIVSTVSPLHVIIITVIALVVLVSVLAVAGVVVIVALLKYRHSSRIDLDLPNHE